MTQVILDRGAKTIQWRKDNFFSTNDVGTIRYPYIKKKKKKKQASIMPYIIYKN